MVIDKLTTYKITDIPCASITLWGEEIRIIRNILADIVDKNPNDATALKEYYDFYQLYELIEKGCLDRESLNALNVIQDKIKQVRN